MREVEMLHTGITAAQVVRHFGVHYQKYRKRYGASESGHDRTRTRCPRVTTLRNDRHIVVQSTKQNNGRVLYTFY